MVGGLCIFTENQEMRCLRFEQLNHHPLLCLQPSAARDIQARLLVSECNLLTCCAGFVLHHELLKFLILKEI